MAFGAFEISVKSIRYTHKGQKSFNYFPLKLSNTPMTSIIYASLSELCTLYNNMALLKNIQALDTVLICKLDAK